ncbi:tRNA (guanine(37)-N1)-methyltransferase isoform X1 [Procambarus clarkii]|uniref:tRNA (guanine(37)-N1)-methyltransferase isoform X1 n=2 Tax=Procambarus clarkii TaxID=6728 RepID=UPI003743315D
MLCALRHICCISKPYRCAAKWYIGLRLFDFAVFASHSVVKYRSKKFIHINSVLHCTENTENIIKLNPYLKLSATLDKLGKIMDESLLSPPAIVRGMTVLDKKLFQSKISVPCLVVKNSEINKAHKCLKKYLLKFQKFKCVMDDENDPDKKVLLLNPLLVRSFEDVQGVLMNTCGIEATFNYKEITLKYENWKAEAILKAVLPENQEGAQSYSLIGHVLHLNLREHMLPYKHLIGQVYLDKISGICLVVNKTSSINSTYRNFQMETLAGSGDMHVTVKENGCTYSMDFEKVYWNPRLSTEHERILKKLKNCDILYDVMAGIGPFAIPAGRKKCLVLANDLNPDSYYALLVNCKQNKVTDKVKCYNLDGHEFIKTVLKDDLLAKWQDKSFCGDVHITMNLPAMAVEFLPAFVGLFRNIDLPQSPALPLVHVYMFASEATEDLAISMVAEKLGYPTHCLGVSNKGNQLSDESSIDDHTSFEENSNCIKTKSNDFGGLRKYVQEVVNIRDVAPKKSMMRVSVQLPLEILLKGSDTVDEPPLKKAKEL